MQSRPEAPPATRAAVIDLGVVNSTGKSSGTPRADRMQSDNATAFEVRVDLGGDIAITVVPTATEQEVDGVGVAR